MIGLSGQAIGEQPTLPPPPVEVHPRPDVAEAMREIIRETRRYIARGHGDVGRLRSHARLNEVDAFLATDPRRAAWHREQAAIWRDHAERVREEVRRAEVALAEYLRWAEGGR